MSEASARRRASSQEATDKFILGLVLVAIAALSACSETGSGAGDCTTPACKLAAIDAASPMSDGDAAVVDYQQALDALAEQCNDTESTLGDFTVTAQELLANGGQSETLLDILQHVSQSIPADAPRMPCADIFSAYVVLRGGKAS